MRIISGAAKGRRLQTIDGIATRPTTDRIKETLFNIIAFDIPDCRFLDLFSGSGAIGLEALSRGAREAVFVESNPQCQQVIRENLAHCRLEENALLLPADAAEGLRRLSGEGRSFDIIFMDPPYRAGLTEPILQEIVAKKILDRQGYIILERSAQIPLAEVPGLVVFREKEYRTTVLTFLCLEEETI